MGAVVKSLLILFFAVPLAATTYYVDRNHPLANDSNPGTESLPWKTINKGAQTLVAGDTAYVKAGTYDEHIEFANNGTQTYPITFKSYSGWNTIVKYSGHNNHTVTFTKEYIVWDGFKVTCLFYQPLRINPGAAYCIIKNCDVDADTESSHGILIESDAVHHITIMNNLIHGFGTSQLHHGMYIKGDYHLIDGNIIYDNAGYGIHMYNDAGSVKHCIVRNNTCYENGVRSANGGAGIIVTQGVSLVYNNVCYNNGGGSNSNSYGILVYNVPAGSGANKIYNNTLYKNGRGGLGIQGSDSTILKNNICAYDSVCNLSMLNSTNTILNHNCYYPDGANRFFWNRGVYNFSGYRLASGQDSSSICQEPRFVDTSSYNFHLQATSPAVDRGFTLPEVPLDKDGITRPQGIAYDIGAYEYVPTGITEEARSQRQEVRLKILQNPTRGNLQFTIINGKRERSLYQDLRHHREIGSIL